MGNEADRIKSVIAAVPQNVTAAKVMGSGVHYEHIFKPGKMHWQDPPAMKPYVPQRNNAEFKDLSGRTVGRFRVMGLLDSANNRWVVRCRCGAYEIRNSKTIKASKNPDDCCRDCEHLKFIQRRYKELGSRPFSHFHPGFPDDGGKT